MFSNKLLTGLIYINALYLIGLNASSIVVNTTSGLVSGTTVQALNQPIDQFLNIPFAKPPIGSLRFRKPVPLNQTSNGIVNNRPEQISCIQSFDPKLFFSNFPDTTQTEDCLVLNIYTPHVRQSNKLKAVMVWLFGGGSQVGSIFQYNGSFLAANDVVFVAPNYRLGTFGFFFGGSDSAPGNQGLYDQRLALLWVRDNIERFGGDPKQITIFGESAGGFSVSAHIISPLARGLFKRSIMESGAHMHNKERDILNSTESLQQAINAAAQVGCTDPNTFVDCLRQMDTSVISRLLISTIILEGTEYLPLSAQQAFAERNYNRDVDILAGTNRDEGSTLATIFVGALGVQIPENVTVDDFRNFVTALKNGLFFGLNVEKVVEFYLKRVNTSSSASLLKALDDFVGDAEVTCPTYLFTKLYSKLNPKKRVFFYEFTYSHLDLIPGCVPASDGICHESELPYLFGSAYTESAALQIDKDISAEILKLWTNFAKFGNPISDTTRVREWPQLLSDKNSSLVKELNPFNFDRIFDNPYKRTCDGFWSNFFF